MRPPIALETYEEFGRAYAKAIETNAWNAGYERPSTLVLLPQVSGLNVLDAGCGPGIYAQWLHEKGAKVTAIDVSPSMIALAKERLPGTADVRQWNLEEHPLPFSEGSFDLILSSLAIHYVQDLEGLFRDFFRILRTGGHFVFSTHHPIVDFQNHNTGNYFATELVEEEWDTIGRPVKVRFYRRPISTLFDCFLKAGFKLDALSEGKPSEECRLQHPKIFAQLERQPGFLFLRLKKI